ncbi:MAG TPA: LysR family transcriptional regulator [Anaeromyxobacteraceae bacterium]|nr:LysR family transcriptional regulator [Anaeromyxobacteraceae bacterium]
MTLTQLEHMLQAHETGSFTRAARVCGVTQAALSNSIAKLEDELGGRIFSRTTQRVSLSPFGESLLPHVEQVLSGRDALVGAAKAQQAPTTTMIGHSPLIPSPVLAQIVRTVRDGRFGSELRLVEENLSDLLQRLGEHSIDIALLPEAEFPSSIRSAPVFQEQLYYVPRQGAEVGGEQVILKDLAGDTFVMVPDKCGLARRTRALFASRGVRLKVYAGEAMGYHVMQEWAALDLGSAILPQSQLATGTRAVPLLVAAGEPATITYRVAWHREYARGKELGALLQPLRPALRRSAVPEQRVAPVNGGPGATQPAPSRSPERRTRRPSSSSRRTR